MIDVLVIDPILQSMGVLGKVLDLLMQHCNDHPLALIIILLGDSWHPLLLLLRWHNLDLLRCSLDTIYGHTRCDRLVLSIGDIPKLVGRHTHYSFV